MKVSEFKNYECNPDIMTVADLCEHCARLMNEGLGNRIVLVPNDDDSICTDYRCLSNSIDVNDSSKLCVYLDTLLHEEEEYVDKELFSN